MSLKKRLRVLFVCAFLQVGAIAGVPMRPEEITELMRFFLRRIMCASQTWRKSGTDNMNPRLSLIPGIRVKSAAVVDP